MCDKEMNPMPRRPQRPCSYPGCPNRCDGQYCEEHESITNRRYNKFVRSADSNKKYGRAWREIPKADKEVNGKPINPCSITDWCDIFSAKYDLPHINPHAFRHSAATNLIHQNADVVMVSHMLGHSKPSVTLDIYSHAFRDNDSTACNAIADIYFKKAE